MAATVWVRDFTTYAFALYLCLSSIPGSLKRLARKFKQANLISLPAFKRGGAFILLKVLWPSDLQPKRDTFCTLTCCILHGWLLSTRPCQVFACELYCSLICFTFWPQKYAMSFLPSLIHLHSTFLLLFWTLSVQNLRDAAQLSIFGFICKQTIIRKSLTQVKCVLGTWIS